MTPHVKNAFLVFDRAAIRQLDSEAMATYEIPGIILMENAAAGAAQVAMCVLNKKRRVIILCGPGNNGGDGWAMARHLRNMGCDVRVMSRNNPNPRTDAGINATIAHRMRIQTIATLDDLADADLIVDALLGTGLDREVSGQLHEDIDRINLAGPPVLAVDLPSGLDADTGQPLGIAVRATATATFAGWKQGFLEKNASQWTGDIHTIDIGIPAELMQKLGHERSD
jgi:NAD(P)H-hydrate epimerase